MIAPDSYEKFIALAWPMTVPAGVPGVAVSVSLSSIVSYSVGAWCWLVERTKLPKSDVRDWFNSVSNVRGLSTSLYVVDILSVL